MASLKLFLLGPPRLERDERPLVLALRRALALLVYLAIKGQPQSRDTLAALLWPESDQQEARGRLRRTLHRLTEILGETVLLTEADTVRVAPEANVWVDSLAFQRLAAAGLASTAARENLTPEQLGPLMQAAELYADDLLAGFAVPDSPAWDEWQFHERESLRQCFARVLERLVEIYQGQGAWEAAIPYTRRWVALDPLHEPAQRALMRLYALAGQQAAAVRQYQECVRLLEAELGVPPDEETTALYEAIRARRLAPPPRVAAPVEPTASLEGAPTLSARPTGALREPLPSRLRAP